IGFQYTPLPIIFRDNQAGYSRSRTRAWKLQTLPVQRAQSLKLQVPLRFLITMKSRRFSLLLLSPPQAARTRRSKHRELTREPEYGQTKTPSGPDGDWRLIAGILQGFVGGGGGFF